MCVCVRFFCIVVACTHILLLSWAPCAFFLFPAPPAICLCLCLSCGSLSGPELHKLNLNLWVNCTQETHYFWVLPFKFVAFHFELPVVPYRPPGVPPPPLQGREIATISVLNIVALSLSLSLSIYRSLSLNILQFCVTHLNIGLKLRLRHSCLERSCLR